MIKNLQFENFKSWPELDIKCGKITGIFGTNSSGKTSILQFLLLLKQTKDATDRATSLELNGDLVELGAFSDVIHRHDQSLALTWKAGFTLSSPIQLRAATGSKASGDVVGDSDYLEVSSSVVSSAKKIPTAQFLDYKLGDTRFSLAPREIKKTWIDLTVENPIAEDFKFIRTSGRSWPLPGPVKSYAFPDQARTYFQNSGFLADLEQAYENQLDNLYYLGPLREYPKRDYLWARSRPSDVGRRGEKAIDAILYATGSDARRNIKPRAKLMPFQEMVAYWLREIGLIHEFSVRELGTNSNRWQAWVKTSKDSSEVLLTDVGFGISQVLPVITLLQYVPEGSTVILEQPEIHLHPLAQSALADVIIQAATHRNVQVILESHSEHLLLRLQRRLAEGAIASDDIELYFCDTPKGTSKLSVLDVDLYGRIDNWPRYFMGDAFGETAKAEEARLKRMLKAGQP